MNPAALLGLALVAVIGAVIGRAAGGLLFTTPDKAWLRLAAAAAGAVFCLIAWGGLPPVASLAALLPRLAFSEADRADAEMEWVLKAYYPNDYAAVKGELAEMQANGASDEETKDAVRRVAAPLMQRQLPLASTENALELLHIAKDEQAFLSANPDLCYRVLVAPSSASLDELEQALPADLKAREARAAIKLLKQTATAPQPARMTTDLDLKITIWERDAYDALSFGERDALKGGGPLQAKAGCDLVGDFLRPLDMMGGSDAAETYKALSAKGLGQISD